MKRFILGLILTLIPGILFAADFDVSTNQTDYAPGEDIVIDWSVESTSISSSNWIGVFTTGATNNQYRDWIYLTDSESGVVTLNESTPGDYEVRLLTNGGYTSVATSNTFTISSVDEPDDPDDPSDPDAPTYTLDTSATDIAIGDSVTVSWDTDASGVSQDWIGMYRVGAGNGSYIEWFYVGQTSGSRSFTPRTTGDYEFRYFPNNGYTRSAISPIVSVEQDQPDDPDDPDDPTPPSEYDLTLSDTVIDAGDTITLTFIADDSDNLSNDWIGLFRVGRANQNYTDWKYTNAESGDLNFTVQREGTYEFRYFKNNGYTVAATSEEFDVVTNDDPDDPDDPTPPNTQYTVEANQSDYRIGNTADAIWSAPSGANIVFDWIGLYRVGNSDTNYLDYEYTDIFSFREQFPLNDIGTFEFRYFKNNSYQRVAVSDPFTVSQTGGTNLCNGYNLDLVTNYPSPSGRVIALGDSITFGIGASPGEDYVEELEKRLNLNIVNEGIPGDTTEDVLARLDNDVLSRNPSTVIVFIGGNDELRRVYASLSDSAADRQLADELDDFARNRLGYEWDEVPLLTRAETFDNLESIVNQIQATGANTIIVGYDNTLYSDTIATNYARIANETGSIYIPDIYDDIFGRPSRMSDLVHPNDIGYDIIADRIEQGLECLVN